MFSCACARRTSWALARKASLRWISVTLRQVFAGDAPLLGHNVIFDYGFLKQCAVNQGISWEREAIDTLNGNGPRDFTELVMTLGSYMLLAGGKADKEETARRMLRQVVEDGSALRNNIHPRNS